MCAFIRLTTLRLIHTRHHHVCDRTERAETNYLCSQVFQISCQYVESRSCLCVSLCSSVAVLMYRVGAAARSWLFKINTRITPPHFFWVLFRTLIYGRWLWIIHVKFFGTSTAMCRFSARDYSVSERRGAVIERADTISAFFQRRWRVNSWCQIRLLLFFSPLRLMERCDVIMQDLRFLLFTALKVTVSFTTPSLHLAVSALRMWNATVLKPQKQGFDFF